MPIMPVDGIMRDPERILAGAESSMPSPGNQGRIFVAIDTQRIYEDNGTTWVKVGAAGDLISHLADYAAHNLISRDILYWMGAI